MAHGYFNGHDITRVNMSAYGAAGAIGSNPEDIAKWIQALLRGKVLKKKQLEEMLTTVSINSQAPKPPGSKYGLGIYQIDMHQFDKLWWYSGVTEGYLSLFAWLPNQNILITASINSRLGYNYA